MNFNIPAYLFDFSTLSDNRTKCKLKMFYVGETADGRVFDKEFAEELVTSLPYTPVVAFYSDLKDDFIGHNGTQYIYGIVCADAEHGFEVDEDGVEWFVTEVMLFTDRIDNIGEVAKKVVGHAHSLEMDPSTVEYEVFKENGQRKIRFKKARLAGLSVLGEDQNPAFTGSEFFTENEELREKFDNFFSLLHDRGALMEKQEIVTQYVNFIKLTYNEKQRMVTEYAQTQLGDSVMAYVAEMSDDYVVIAALSWEDYSTSFKMYDYAIDEQGVSLSNERACFQRFVTLEQIQQLDSFEVSELKEVVEDKEDEKDDEKLPEDKEDDKEEKLQKKEDEEDKKEDVQYVKDDEDDKDKKDPEDDKENKDDEEDKEDNFVEEHIDTTVEAFTEGVEDNGQEEGTNFQIEEGQENNTTSASKLTDSEREELEAFRLQKKLNLVGTYKDELPAETIASFETLANTCSYDELEAKLAIEYRNFSKQNKVNNATVFSFANITSVKKHNEVETYAELVRKALNK